MTDVAILVPVLARPHRVQPLLDSIAAATTGTYRVLFITDPGDTLERAAIREAGATELPTGGGYAAKINAGVAATSEPLLFLAADDLAFHPGWLDAARAVMTDRVRVIGVNDQIARRPGREQHATHFLMGRDYAERSTIDGGPGPLHTGYHHNFVDDELIATSTVRGAYAYAPAAIVEHLHPMNRTAPDDDTYRAGRARFRLDRKHFRRRSALWAR